MLQKFREERGLDGQKFKRSVEVSNLLEECKEYVDATTDYDRIDALCDICVFADNALHYLNAKVQYYGIKDNYISDIIKIVGIISMPELNKAITIRNFQYLYETSKNAVTALGYNFNKCMQETVKEISSRKQDPKQAKEWAKNGVDGKWQKDKRQKNTYKADYDVCRI